MADMRIALPPGASITIKNQSSETRFIDTRQVMVKNNGTRCVYIFPDDLTPEEADEVKIAIE